MIDNFKVIQEQIINENKPPEQQIVLESNSLIKALERAKKDKEKQKWKQELGQGSGQDSVNKFLQQKMEDISFRNEVLKETLKSVKLVVNPKCKE